MKKTTKFGMLALSILTIVSVVLPTFAAIEPRGMIDSCYSRREIQHVNSNNGTGVMMSYYSQVNIGTTYLTLMDSYSVPDEGQITSGETYPEYKTVIFDGNWKKTVSGVTTYGEYFEYHSYY